MSSRSETGQVARWSSDELRTQRALHDDIVIVDVRTHDARQLVPYEIPGAHWIPLAEVTRSAGQLAREATVVTYCT